jgi:hypothetical protein
MEDISPNTPGIVSANDMLTIAMAMGRSYSSFCEHVNKRHDATRICKKLIEYGPQKAPPYLLGAAVMPARPGGRRIIWIKSWFRVSRREGRWAIVDTLIGQGGLSVSQLSIRKKARLMTNQGVHV